MTLETTTARGVIRPDGTLDVPGKIAAPPGPVEVTVRPVSPVQGESLIVLLNRIRAEQQASGYAPRTVEEVDFDLRRMRDEWDEHDRAIERLQEESLRHRTGAAEPPA